MRCEREPVDVKQRQHVDQHVVGSEPPEAAERSQAGRDVGVRVDNPFGQSRRARAVKHQARCFAADRGLGQCICWGQPRAVRPIRLRAAPAARIATTRRPETARRRPQQLERRCRRGNNGAHLW